MKKYSVQIWPQDWSLEVSVDENLIISKGYTENSEGFTTKMAMKEMILFWEGGKDRLEENNNNVVKTFLQQLAREIYIITIGRSYSVEHVLNEMKSLEGWMDITPENGITISEIEANYIEHNDFEVEESN